MARLTRPAFFLPVCFALGFLFDVLFWDQRWGISFFVYIAALVAVGLWLGAYLKRRPARRSWWLAAAALALGAVSAVYTEEYTLLFTRGFSVVLLMLFAADYLTGDWLNYRLSDHVIKLVSLLPLGWMASGEFKPAASKQARRPWVPVVRGLLLALPVVLVLSALLASADSYFADWVSQVFSFLRLERLPEYVFRFILITLIALALFGAYVYGFVRSKSGAAKKPVVQPFIGFTEAGIVLGSVALLLGAFVVFQFQYFFGGVGNILGPEGYVTYAEYARRGFAELCVVAVLVLMLFVLLSSITRRSPQQQGYFSGLGVARFALLAVVLVSAFQRLLLYEEAYGFTSMRLLPHIFMVWLGLLLLALVVMELTGRQRYFAAAVLLAAVGFVATLPALNLDRYTVRANIAHGLQASETAWSRETVDRMHLAELSPDAVPALVEGYRSQLAAGNQELAQDLAIALACNAYKHDAYAQSWREWTLSRALAASAWQSIQDDPGIPAVMDGREYGQPFVTLNGEDYGCYYPEL
ncbi:MAG: DUF4173 domain-containing protein [Anaerolineales bacterium]|nr:DUF4173 domain-containing protein [Anaerolineales bacterium]